MNTHSVLLSVLQGLSFEKEESLVFLVLAEHGAMNVTAISKKTKLSRTTVYKTLETLLAKKRITTATLHARVLYESVDPSNLISELEEKTKQGARELSLLSHKHKASFFIPTTTMFKGQENINSIYEDIVNTLPQGGTYFRYTSRRDDYTRTPLYQHNKHTKEIERLVITSSEKAKTKEKDSNRFIKIVPKDFAFDDNVSLLIYGQKVAYIDYNSMTGTVIESPQLARFQEKIFKLLWKKL